MHIPSGEDLYYMGRGYGWPAVSAGGIDMPAGEAGWRRVTEALSEDARRRFYEAWCAQPAPASQARNASSATPMHTRESSASNQTLSAAALAVVVRAYRVVLSQGLKLPASAFRVQWFERDAPDTALGVIDPTTTPISIHIASGMTEQATFKTLVHEFQHAADVLRLGRDAWRAMPADEKERRAEGFSWVCVHAEYGDALQIFA